MRRTPHTLRPSLWLAIAVMMGLWLCTACSTKKNTPGVRFYHAQTAHFNTYHNARVAYDEGTAAQDRGHKDDYTQLLPMYVSTTKATQNQGKSSFETAITKCEKAIKVHSIKVRPEVKGGKSLSAEKKRFMARKEFNPFLYRAWLLMAQSQFRKGDFIECATTCQYIMRIYAVQPQVANVARALLARCYVALEWPYDAEDVLSKMGRDSLTPRALQAKEETQAAWHIATGQLAEAIPLLERTIGHTRGKLQRARLRFLLGQLYQHTGNQEMAFRTYGRVIRSSPPYAMAFSARIQQTECVSQAQAPQMIKKLRRMARSDKNKDYLDQVYHAMGNIYLAQQDTARAIGAYEKGAEESKGNSPAKAALLMSLSEIYWLREDYINAARTYQACVAALGREHHQYAELKHRSDVLKELEPHLSAVHLQDSLQELARMDEAGRNAAIDRVIEALKKKEKEEEKKRDAAELAQRQGAQSATTSKGKTGTSTTTQPAGQAKGDWYFYNPSLVQQGQKEFQKQWGKRKDEDNWRYSSREGLPETASDAAQSDVAPAAEPAPSPEQLAADSLARAEALKDSLENDPHQREFYLKEIPFTEEMMQASNDILSKELLLCGQVEQDRLENFPRAKRTLERVARDFPAHEQMDNILYRLFLLTGRLREEGAEHYRQLLTDSFPNSKYAQTVMNPHYEQLALRGAQMEDSVYAAAYQAYQASNYSAAEESYQWYAANFEPGGKHHARMLFVRAMSNLYAGERDTFLTVLRDVVKRYPKEEVTQLAQSIVKGIDEGRIPVGERMDGSNIWNMRLRGAAGDSAQAAPALTDERFSQFAFVLAYPAGEVDEDRLVFELARYNFTNFMVRNFDLEITTRGAITLMAVKGFQSYDEVHSYAQQLYADEQMSQAVRGLRSMLISEDNLKLVGTDFSFDEYKDFQEEKLTPIEVPDDFILDEPKDLEIIDPEQIDPTESEDDAPTEEGEEEEPANDDDFPFGF